VLAVGEDDLEQAIAQQGDANDGEKETDTCGTAAR
jgi:hypothetical protein